MADTHSVAEKMRLSEHIRKKLNEERPILSAEKCRPMTSFWRYKIYANVRVGSQRSGRQTTVGLSRTAIFSVLLAIFFGHFRDEASFIMAICSLSLAFQWSQNAWPWNTMNGSVKFCFCVGLAGWDRTTSESNCVKTNKDRHILSAVRIFGRDSSFWRHKVCADIRSGSLERRC